MLRGSLAVVFLAILLAACSENYGDPTQPVVVAPDKTPLRPMTKLKQGIYGFPDRDFGPENMAQLAVFRNVGQKGIDFELDDLDGNTYRLADLLREKPVVLFMGSYSCPVYQERIREINKFANAEFDLGGKFSDWVYFVHVYVVEAHPQAPAVAPHFGGVYEDEFSTVPQAKNYVRRQTNASLLAPKIGANQLLLLDDLRPHGFDNPVWSTYGSGAASAWFIRQDGVIGAAHDWLDVTALQKTVRLMLLGVGI